MPTTLPAELTPRGQRWLERTQKPLDLLALVFLVDFLLLWGFPDAPAPAQTLINGVAWAVWAGFAIDYTVRWSCAIDRHHFVRSHKLDLLMVLLPMLRLLRVFLLLRRSLASVSSDRIAGSIVSIVAVVVFAGAYLVWRVEYNAPGATITSYRQAVWWAIVTTTTVGYGDYTPVTPQGRVIASCLMVVGVGLIGTVSATVAAYFVKRPSPADGVEQAPAVDASASVVPAATTAALIERLDALAAEQREVRLLLERLTADD